MTQQTASAAETEAVGGRLAKDLARGDVVLVSGEVGAGKTTLIRGACRALGVTDPVTSPTFTIGQRYRGGRAPVAHLDLYRLESMDGEDPGLLEDYLDSGTIAFVEWPQAGAPLIERIAARVEIRHAGGDRREISVGWAAASDPD